MKNDFIAINRNDFESLYNWLCASLVCYELTDNAQAFYDNMVELQGKFNELEEVEVKQND